MYQPQGQPQGNLEVEIAADEEDDSRSELGSSVASSRTSLRDSIIDYRIENGRTYHRYKEGKYALPNDERENNRLDLCHQLWLITLDDRLGVAPPCESDSKVGRVLDVGTGTGIWAIDFGDEHPEADVYGNDLSAVRPNLLPPNVRFEVDDVEDEWTYSRPFEYIHSRLMTSSLSDWPAFIRNCYENLEPGGYLELQESDLIPRSDDGTLKPEHALLRWANTLLEASVKLGRPYMEIPGLKQLMIDAGFEDVTIHIYKWPTNTWPKDQRHKEIGMWNNENVRMGLEGYTMAPFTRALDWTAVEVNVFLIDVRKNLDDRSIHAYWPEYAIVGRKPHKKEETPAAA